MNNKNKILYFSVLSEMAGAENSLYGIVSKMSKDKTYSIGVIVPHPGKFSEKLKNLNVQIFFLSKVAVSPLKKSLLYPITLFKIIKNFKPQILHSNTKGCIKYILLSRIFLKFKWIQHIRGNFIKGDSKLFHKLLINLSDVRIGISNSVKKSYKRQNDKGFFILYNAFDFDRFPKKLNDIEIKNFKKKLNIPLNKKIILNIGRFTPIKRQKLLIESAKNLKDYIFLFLGNSIFNRKEDKLYFDKMKSMKLNLNNVYFLGWQDNLYKYYSIADIYVHVSEMEAFGRVLIEAMFYELPVVCPPNGGMKEIIENGSIGLFFNNSIEDLEKKIRYAIKNYPDENELERRQKIVLNLYSMDTYIKNLKGIYEKLLK